MPNATPQPCAACLSAPAECALAWSIGATRAMLDDARHVLARQGLELAASPEPGDEIGPTCQECADDILGAVADLARGTAYPIEQLELDAPEIQCAACRRMFPDNGNNACESCASEFEDDQDDDDEESEEL